MDIADNQVVDSAQRWVSAEIKQGSPAWRENLSRWLEADVALVGDAAWGAQIRDLVKLPIPDPLAWANRWIELPGGQWAIAGIRFRGRDVEKPFVDIIATSLPPEAAGIEALAEVLPHFEEFAPLCLRVNLPESTLSATELSETEDFHGDAQSDLLIVASPVDEMKMRSQALLFDATTLVPCSVQDAAQLTTEIYERLATPRPQLREWATPADAQSLEEAADQDLLFEIRVNDETAGIVAAERQDAYGFTGFCMQEIALNAAHRGRGIGVAALQHLVRALDAKPHDLLWGHIHPGNIPSLSNAQASGRKIVTSHAWITPTGYPGMPS